MRLPHPDALHFRDSQRRLREEGTTVASYYDSINHLEIALSFNL